MLTESHTAVFRCELCEKLCETLWETLSITANASPIKIIIYKTIIGNIHAEMLYTRTSANFAVKLIFNDLVSREYAMY